MKLPRAFHTQNEFLTCGGITPNNTGPDYYYNTPHNCEVYNPLTASWSLESYNLTENMILHNSWSLGNGSVLLLGGVKGWTLSELHAYKTEMVTQGIGSTKSFDLQHPC